ncbi:MAG: SpoIID/LytB domain-containing protein [Myxococcales bacterium]|nr:SpoIID/LytB domain-containing protein [Myxococcales bacterium]
MREVALLALLLAAPALSQRLSVRLLERERPVSARLQSEGGLFCDGQPLLLKEAALRSVGNQVELGGETRRACDEVSSRADGARVSVGELSRPYAGRLRVRSDGVHLVLFEDAEPEEYLSGVVAAEQPPGPKEAMKALSVVSRTFALAGRARHQRAGYSLCDLSHCQLYRGLPEGRADAMEAVKATRGEVLLAGGVVLRPAFFHSSCGGGTSAASDVFGEAGLDAAVTDSNKGGPPLCAGSPDFTWEWTVERTSLAEAVGAKGAGAAFEPLRRDRAGRVLEVRSFGVRMSGLDFLLRVGRTFGYGELRGMKVRAEEAESKVRFEGRGRGHGVGLCQEGALALGEKGWDYRRILAHYFPGSTVRKVPGR